MHVANNHADLWPALAAGLVTIMMLCYCCVRRWQDAHLRREVVSTAAVLGYESHQADVLERKERSRRQLVLVAASDDEDDDYDDDADGNAVDELPQLEYDKKYIGDFRLAD